MLYTLKLEGLMSFIGDEGLKNRLDEEKIKNSVNLMVKSFGYVSVEFSGSELEISNICEVDCNDGSIVECSVYCEKNYETDDFMGIEDAESYYDSSDIVYDSNYNVDCSQLTLKVE